MSEELKNVTADGVPFVNPTAPYKVGQIFAETYPPEVAVFCNSNGYMIKEIGPSVYQIVEVPGPSVEELQRMKITELEGYLSQTDWLVIRFNETGKEYPEEVKTKREAARLEISELRNKVSE